MFDGRRFLLDHFQTPQRVTTALGVYDLPVPSIAAVEKWFSRGRVSAEYLPLLICVRELETGQCVTLSTYLAEATA